MPTSISSRHVWDTKLVRNYTSSLPASLNKKIITTTFCRRIWHLPIEPLSLTRHPRPNADLNPKAKSEIWRKITNKQIKTIFEKKCKYMLQNHVIFAYKYTLPININFNVQYAYAWSAPLLQEVTCDTGRHKTCRLKLMMLKKNNTKIHVYENKESS